MNNKMIIAGGAAVLLAGVGFIVFSSDKEIAEVIQEAETQMAQDVRSEEQVVEDEANAVIAAAEEKEAQVFSPSSIPERPAVNAVVLGELEPGNLITIQSATLLKSGYIVLYRINSKGDTSFVGKSDILSAGTHTGVRIQLGAPAIDRQAIVAVLHADDGDGKFEYPGADEYLLNGTLLTSDIDVVGVKRSDRESRVLETQVRAFLETNFQS